MQFAPNFKKGLPPSLQLERVSRNEASTFLGLCGQHDADIFRSLDTKRLILSNREQLFLIAWRSVTRELHACMEAGQKGQDTLEWAVKNERVSPDQDSFVMRETTAGLLKAHRVYQYRAINYDMALLQQRYSQIDHDVTVVAHARPTLSVSALFAIDELETNGHVPYAAVNVIPLDASHSAVVFSYSKKDRRRTKQFFAPFLKSKGDAQKILISRFVIGCTENFVLSPAYVNAWPNRKKNAILSAYAETHLVAAFAPDIPEMMLFE